MEAGRGLLVDSWRPGSCTEGLSRGKERSSSGPSGEVEASGAHPGEGRGRLCACMALLSVGLGSCRDVGRERFMRWDMQGPCHRWKWEWLVSDGVTVGECRECELQESTVLGCSAAGGSSRCLPGAALWL